jgi:ABC-2 type transport system ATP-binding protein
MKSDLAIKVDHISKDFFLPNEKGSRSIKSSIVNLAKRSKNHGGSTQHALKDISFEVKQGDFFGIVGRNGSGKSTLLKILAGIYRPTKGSVVTAGRLVPFIELGVGFNPELTGRENIYLNGALLGFSRSEIDAVYDDIVDFAELHRFMDQKLKNYSSGMQVRLAFSVATHAQADLLLVDEVLAVGDADFQRKCFNYFKQLKRTHTTVVFVSHDMNAIREYCTKAIMIEHNEIFAIGRPDKVAQEYSKLFSAEDSQVGAKTNRWGIGGLAVSDVKIHITKTEITIQQTIAATSLIESPVIGFRIRSLSGDGILGTSSRIEKKKVDTIELSTPKTFTWTFSNILASGTYYLDVSVHNADGATVYDWWDEALKFDIKKPDRQFPYSVDPGYNLSIRQ